MHNSTKMIHRLKETQKPAQRMKYAHARPQKQILNVILGKNPGAALKKHGQNVYSFEAQKKKCTAYFDHKYGKKKWKVKPFNQYSKS